MAKSKELPENLQIALKKIIDEFDLEDRVVRERQIRQWKKLEFFWSGITKIWWSETAHDWRIHSDDGDSNDYYGKEINVFRAYLETVIAALSSTVPPVRCKPDDADNPSDILTARGGTKIASLIYEHNDAPLLWIKALFVYCTQGMIAAYNYTKESKEYGEVEVADFKDSEEEYDFKLCPICGMELSGPDLDMAESLSSLENDEYDPDHDDIVWKNEINNGRVVCPTCAVEIDPELKKSKIIVNRLVGVTRKAKSRQCIEVNGGLYVKVPNYARCQEDTPYVAYCYETHYSNIYKKYPELRKKFPENTKITSSGNDSYERWGRLSPQYYGEYPTNTPTVRNWWLRNSAFETLNDDDERRDLQKRFPDGCKVVFVNEIYAESCNENLDDHWTLTYNPLSESIHFDPLGALLTSIQEITNDLISLTLQTIEHGVPQTFADPSVLDFKAYRETEVVPGAIYPAKAKGGKNVGDGFYTVSTSQLSREVDPFGNKIQEYAQFVSGALPSLFGGAQPGSSRTAAQYSMSRNQALQRLQTPWKMINFWWQKIFGKVIPAYIKTMLDDERIVKEEHNSFINVIIRKAQLDGKIGSVTVQSSEELPQGAGQVKDAVMALMQLQNPVIMEAMGSPENLEILREAIGLVDFNLPGESDREKQFEEIHILLNSSPINEQMPSLMPDFEIDNHILQADICRSWLIGEAGRQAKVENPGGYQNVLLHYKIHIQMLQAMQQPVAPQQVEPQKTPKLRPIEGNRNAS